MRIVIRDAAGRSELVEKNVVEGRTLVRLAQGQRLEVVDPRTGRVPADLRAHRGGDHGEDLVLESNGAAVEVEGFFDLPVEEQIAALSSLESAMAEVVEGEGADIGAAADGWGGGTPIMLAQADNTGSGGDGQSGGSRSSSGTGGGVSRPGLWAGIGGGILGVGVAVSDDDDDPAPTYSLTASASQVDEGGDVTFTLSTTNVKPGTQYDYQITGISSDDLESGSLSGTVTIGADGKAVIHVALRNDLTTEGVETLVLTVAGQTAQVTVRDTSTTPVPTYEVTASAEAVDEGDSVTFTLKTTNVAEGTQFDYEIVGVNANDLVGGAGALNGKVTIGADGIALVTVTLREDFVTEGDEVLKIRFPGLKDADGNDLEVAVTVNDTSLAPTYEVTASAEAVDEGDSVTFTLKTTNVAEGTQFDYEIVGVSAADVVGGAAVLSGKVTIGANGIAQIPVTLVADALTEGDEVMKIRFPGLKDADGNDLEVAVTVNDTSLAPVGELTADRAEVNEAGTVTFTLTTQNVAPGTQYDYQILGVDGDDVVGGAAALTGKVTIGADGKATIAVALVADERNEGEETLRIRIIGLKDADGNEVEAQVTVKDTSKAPPLTNDEDHYVGDAEDNVIRGRAVGSDLDTHTYQPHDSIDGGDGNDTLDLVLDRHAMTSGVEVKNVENVVVQTIGDGDSSSGGVTLDMALFDDSVESIRIHHSTGSLTIKDQQSIADVTIEDSTLSELHLDYDSHVVQGDDDQLNLSLSDVSGPNADCPYANVSVDDGIEALSLDVGGAKDETSYVSLDAPGVTDIVITGGVIGQNFALHLEQVNAKYEDADGNETRDHATLDATGYAGNVRLTGIDGGRVRHTYTVEVDKELGVGESVRIVINGLEGVITLDEVTDGIAHFVLDGDLFENTSAQRILGDGDTTSISNATLLEVLRAELFQALRSMGVSKGNENHLILTSYGDPLDIEISVEADGNSSSFTVEETRHRQLVNEISTLKLGDGNDYVSVGYDLDKCGEGQPASKNADLTYASEYDLGDGNNILRVGGNIFGTVLLGGGNDAVQVGKGIGGSASISFGAGDGLLVVNKDIFGEANITFDGGNNLLRGGSLELADDELAEDDLPYAGRLRGFGSVVFNGEGNGVAYLKGISEYGHIEFNKEGQSALFVKRNIKDNATVEFHSSENFLEVGGSIWGSGVNVSFGDGVSTANVEGSIGKATVTFGASGDFLSVGGGVYGATIGLGGGDNEARIAGSVKGSEITSLDGNDTLAVGGSVYGSTIDVGGGNNQVSIDGSVKRSSFSSADGDDTLTIGGGVERSTVELGGGNDALSIGCGVSKSTIDLGDGNNVATIIGAIKSSTITSGGDDDQLTLGDGKKAPYVRGRGENALSEIDLGGGNDTLTINGSKYGSHGPVVGSGAFLNGGDGDGDTLTVRAVDDLDLVGRTHKQVTKVTLDGTYEVGQEVSITIGGKTITVEVEPEDIVQGTPEDVASKVAAKLEEAIEQAYDGPDSPPLCIERDKNVLKFTGVVGDAQIEVTAENATVENVRVADAGISGFETLNLIALNPVTSGDACNDNDKWTGDISVDFEMVDGVTQINLISEVARREVEHNDTVDGIELVNGAYTEYKRGDSAEFTLTNLPAGLGEHIRISANEVTATGNRQVAGIKVPENADFGSEENDDGFKVGDKLTVAIGEWEVEYEITEADLDGPEGIDDAINIAAALAERIAAAAEEHGFTVVRDDNFLTLFGSSDRNVNVDVIVKRGDEVVDDVVDVTALQSASRADDKKADVKLNASLADGVDGSKETLVLEIDGTGNFDLAIDGARKGGGGAYKNLTLNVVDGFSHYIDTDKNNDNKEFVGGKIELNGGVAGASIVIDDVMAKEVISTSEADVTIVFDKNADDDGDYTFDVHTQSGNDTVDMRGVILTHNGQPDIGRKGAVIDLGESEDDRLIISNGRWEAADAVGLASVQRDDDRMFAGVRNVEELVFDGSALDEGGKNNGITFDDHAFAAGFKRLTITKRSKLDLLVGEAFARGLEVDAGRKVVFNMDVYNDDGTTITVNADDRLKSRINLMEHSDTNLNVIGGKFSSVVVNSNGRGDWIDISLLKKAKVDVEQNGDGKVTVSVGDQSNVTINQNGSGKGDVTVGAESTVTFTGGEGHGDLSISQLGSNKNTIVLKNLYDEADVKVEIALTGADGPVVIKDYGGEDPGEEYSTHLSVQGESHGGIDSLVVLGEGAALADTTVHVKVDDSWAVGDEDDEDNAWNPGVHDVEDFAADMVIDLSSVTIADVNGDESEEGVLVDALDERDAQLRIEGSDETRNVLLGGAKSDYLVGGNGDDILYGGNALREDGSAVKYAGRLTLTLPDLTEIDPEWALPEWLESWDEWEGSGIPAGWLVLRLDRLTVDGDPGYPEDPDIGMTLKVKWPAGGFKGEEMAEFLEALFKGENVGGSQFALSSDSVEEEVNDYLSRIESVERDGNRLILYLYEDPSTEGPDVWPWEGVFGAFGDLRWTETPNPDDDLRGNTGLTTKFGAVDFTVEQNVSVADILEGGDGADLYVIEGGDFDTMDTIVGLDLNGEDQISFGWIIKKEELEDWDEDKVDLAERADFLKDLGAEFVLVGGLTVEKIVNGGAVKVLEGGPSLAEALEAMFQGGGLFTGNTATNAAGLFQHGEDHYLVAVGSQDTGSFGADDIIVKVTGVTGLLTMDDFYQPWIA